MPLDAVSVRLRSSETERRQLRRRRHPRRRRSRHRDRQLRQHPRRPRVSGRTAHAPHLVALHPFDNVICKVAVPGRVVLEALNSGVSKLPATAGMFPQVSGLTIDVDRSAPPGTAARDVRVDGQPLDPDRDLHGRDSRFHAARRRRLRRCSPAARCWSARRAGNLIVGALETATSPAARVAPRSKAASPSGSASDGRRDTEARAITGSSLRTTADAARPVSAERQQQRRRRRRRRADG